jgi:hypothetical protein
MKIGFTALVIALSATSAFAQNTAALGGTIQDSTGAVVPRAAVKLTSHEQGTVRTAESNASGTYSFSFLPRGVYDVEVTATGFRTTNDKDITIATAENVRRDYTLEVGNVSDNVTVSADVQTVNTDNAEMGAVLDNTKVTEMPLNGRTFYSLATLTPGATAPLNGQGYRGAFSVAGASQVANNFTLNGMDNNDPTIAIPNFRPSIDAIQEFNILTGIYPAQYGLGSGGQIIVSTKSGTNSFHGSAYEFLRNSYMDARNFFTPPGPTPAFKRNQFGSTIGGPIKKNKLFFFHSYEGLRLSQAQTALTTVPTLEMIGGDFSSLLSLKTPIILKDPNGGTFAGNIIPQSRLNTPAGTIARDLLSYYPAPTFATPTGQAPGNNYAFNVPRPEKYMQHSLKIDYTISQKDSAYLTVNYYKDSSVETGTSSTCNNTTLPKFPCDLSITNQVYGLSETHIFSPSLVNEFRIGYTHTYTPSEARNGNIDFWGPYGVTPLLSTFTKVPTKGLPVLNLTGYNAFSSSRSFIRSDPHSQLTDTASLTRGRHTIKIGFNYLHYKTGNLDLGSQGGTLTFSNTSQGPTTGYGVADVLLGLPTSSANTPYRYQNYVNLTNVAAFIQDDYKVSSRLTLNIGLRWEMNTPLRDDANRLTNFNPVTGTPITQSNPSPDAPFSAPVGFGEHPYHFDWHDYAPRFGFAWQPFGDGKTVVRGGAGTFYTTYSLNNALGNLFAGFPYQTTYTYTSSLTAPVLLTNPFPGGGTNATTTNSLNGAEQNFKNAVTYQWSLGVQREVAKDMIAEATYFGYQASHQQGTHDINQPAPGPGTPAQVNARRPYPLYGAINMYQWDRNASFHSLQTKLQKRYGYGLSFLATYMWSHEIDDQGTPTNQSDFRTTRGSGSIDTRHRFVISPVYELPFGKGKPYLTHGVVAAIVGGWQIAPLIQWQTGNPLTATLTGNFSNTQASSSTADRPDLIGDPNANAPHTPQEWFNVAAFAPTRAASGAAGATYSFGNEGKGVIVSPGLVNMDVSIVRTFSIKERVRIQLRGEFFNALNHTNFNFPTAASLNANTPSTFGTITSAQDPRQIQVALKVSF